MLVTVNNRLKSEIEIVHTYRVTLYKDRHTTTVYTEVEKYKRADLEVEDNGPDETKCELGVAVDDLISTNVHQPYLHTHHYHRHRSLIGP